jgi:hypothetical protein
LPPRCALVPTFGGTLVEFAAVWAPNGRVAREQGLDQERLRLWVSFLALCGVLESAVERGVIDIYYLKGGVAMELRFARESSPIAQPASGS